MSAASAAKQDVAHCEQIRPTTKENFRPYLCFEQGEMSISVAEPSIINASLQNQSLEADIAFSSIQYIRETASKIREIQAWAQTKVREAFALANQASTQARAAEERACYAESALSAAIARAEKAEQLFMDLNSKTVKPEVNKSANQAQNVVKPLPKNNQKIARNVVEANSSTNFPNNIDIIGKNIDLHVGDHVETRSVSKSHVHSGLASQSRTSELQAGILRNFRNEGEFHYLTY